jgi:hypothetical protein
VKLPRIRIRRSSRPRYDRGTGASPAAVPVTALTAAAARQHLIPGTLRDVHDWIAYGVARGWVIEACATHDGIPSTPEEDALWEDGLDPCQHVLRLRPDGQPAGSTGEREHLRANGPVGRDSDGDGLVEDGRQEK